MDPREVAKIMAPDAPPPNRLACCAASDRLIAQKNASIERLEEQYKELSAKHKETTFLHESENASLTAENDALRTKLASKGTSTGASKVTSTGASKFAITMALLLTYLVYYGVCCDGLLSFTSGPPLYDTLVTFPTEYGLLKMKPYLDFLVAQTLTLIDMFKFMTGLPMDQGRYFNLLLSMGNRLILAPTTNGTFPYTERPEYNITDAISRF